MNTTQHDDGGLPMDYRKYHEGAKQWPPLHRYEHAVYWRHYQAHVARVPAYEKESGRPSPTMAAAVWAWLKPDDALDPLSIRSLFPKARYRPDDELARIAQQALVVVLDVFVRATQSKKPVSLLWVFNALAERWSDHYRQALRDCPGIQSVRDMRLETVESIRRDLLCQDINVAALWKLATAYWSRSDEDLLTRAKRGDRRAFELHQRRVAGLGGRNPLYVVKGPIPTVGYQVLRCDPDGIPAFEAIVNEDQTYQRPPARSAGLLFAHEKTPQRPKRQKFAGEQPYNVVENGKRSDELLGALEASTLLFNVDAFRLDYKRYARRLHAQAKRATGRSRTKLEQRIAMLFRVREQVQALHGWVPVKSGFFRAINRRYHGRHFWPEHVSGKLDPETYRAPRDWFAFPPDRADEPPLALQGYDVSASQTQLLAVFLGLTDLEAIAADTTKPFKVYLAEQARKAYDARRLPLRKGYEDMAKLVPLVKTLWTRHLYGSKVQQIVKEERGWIARKVRHGQKGYNAAVAEATRCVKRFLEEDLPWYGKPGEGKLSDYYRACQRIGQVCQQRYPYRGAEFIDPFDQKVVRFNPVQRATYRLRSDYDLRLSLPGRWTDKAHKNFRHADRDPETGDYPVDGGALGRTLAPSLVHMLDAGFSASVVEWLQSVKVRNVVALHDAWYVSEVQNPLDRGRTNGQILHDIMGPAAMEWFLRLEPLYVAFERYLGADPEYGPFVRRIAEQWRAREDSQDWPYPTFAVAPALVETDLPRSTA